MRGLYPLPIFVCLSLASFAQMRTITGRLTSSEDGSPLPGVNVVIKGTNQGTTTDVDGYYSIDAPVGSTLVFSFIGMQTQEYVVGPEGTTPADGKRQSKKPSPKINRSAIPSSLYSDTVPVETAGIAILSDDTPSYRSREVLNPAAIRRIRRVGNRYIITHNYDYRPRFQLAYTTSFSLEQAYRLPGLQQEYVQGRVSDGAVQWRGPDAGELFSWGPSIKTLEFNGEPYAYDRNGLLVSSGQGNGIPAIAYDPMSFFRTGQAHSQDLFITLAGPRYSSFVVNLEHRNESGIIPNASHRRTNASIAVKNLRLWDVVAASGTLLYNESTGDLLGHRSNLASIVASVYRTPISFDNTDGERSAIRSTNAYLLTPGVQRVHAPGLADNPFGLAALLPDRDYQERILGYLELDASPGQFRFTLKGKVDHQWSLNQFGTPPGFSGAPAGRMTRRSDEQTALYSLATAAYHGYLEHGDLSVRATLETRYTRRNLQRIDGFAFATPQWTASPESATSVYYRDYSLSRTANDLLLELRYEQDDWLNVRLTNRQFFSNTLREADFVNLFPSLSAAVEFVDLLNYWYWYPLDSLRPYVTVSRTLRQAPLLYSNAAFASTALNVEAFTSFYEMPEIVFMQDLLPETERQFETGLEAGLDLASISFSWYDSRTSDLLVPQNHPDGPKLINAAHVRNRGILANIEVRTRHKHWGVFKSRLNWSRYRSKVEEITTGDEHIPLAGFKTIQTVLAENQPVGAIYGTTYLRNAAGQLIIGEDGFPIEDHTLRMIGNPLPDWTLSWSPSLESKRFRVAMVVEWKYGGDVWNGTSSTLDYLGRSELTGQQRGLSQYLFDGITIDNNLNTTPVSFYDPSMPLDQNRWVRYGWDGVGEANIEDASWVRLQEFSLGYTIRSRQEKSPELALMLYARNLFTLAGYSGSDPSAALFGYATGAGLDYFSMPLTRTYGAKLQLKI